MKNHYLKELSLEGLEGRNELSTATSCPCCIVTDISCGITE